MQVAPSLLNAPDAPVIQLHQAVIVLIGLQWLVAAGAGATIAALIDADRVVDQSQADLLLILNDALVGIAQGLYGLFVETTGGVVDESFH